MPEGDARYHTGRDRASSTQERGVGRGSGMHSLQERIDSRSLHEGAAFLKALLRTLLAENGQ